MMNGYKKIFWGMFFSTFHFNLGSIEILPNFVGILIICSGIKEILGQCENSSLNWALRFNNISAFISFITFILPFMGIANPFNNIISSTIWFNIGGILEILSIVKLLEGSSQILSEKYDSYLGIEYKNKAIKYIYLYPIAIIASNINFIFMSEIVALGIAIYAVIIKIWAMFSFKRLYRDDLQIVK